MPPQPDKQLLSRWLETLRTLDPDAHHLASYGHCDAFALALMSEVSREFPGAKMALVVVYRERVALDDPGHILDSNPLSHVLLDIDDVIVDVGGVDADQSWEESWIQPEEDDEIVPSEDVFDYQPMTVEALVLLRRTRDNRDPDPKMIKKFKSTLSRALEITLSLRKPSRSARPR